MLRMEVKKCMVSRVGSSPGYVSKVVARVSCSVSVSTLIKKHQCLFIYYVWFI